MAGSTANQITGDDIISELIRNADAGWFKVRYTVLVPCIFNVYLHPRDYGLIQPVVDLIREEAVRALQEHLSRPEQTPYRMSVRQARRPQRANPGLNTKFLRSNGRSSSMRTRRSGYGLAEIEIYSELGSARPKDFGAGAMTTLITRHNPGASEGTRSRLPRVADQGFSPGSAIEILERTTRSR